MAGAFRKLLVVQLHEIEFTVLISASSNLMLGGMRLSYGSPESGTCQFMQTSSLTLIFLHHTDAVPL